VLPSPSFNLTLFSQMLLFFLYRTIPSNQGDWRLRYLLSHRITELSDSSTNSLSSTWTFQVFRISFNKTTCVMQLTCDPLVCIFTIIHSLTTSLTCQELESKRVRAKKYQASKCNDLLFTRVPDRESFASPTGWPFLVHWKSHVTCVLRGRYCFTVFSRTPSTNIVFFFF
jgi:hypothetical protein